MASVPGFDPSLFFHGIDVANWKDLTSDTYRPLTNKATTGQYAPGSTFKPITALSILKKGIDPTERVMCPGQYRLGNATFHCWKKGGHGYVDMIGAIQHSCDVYFYEMSRRVGVDAIAEMAGQFGLGRITEIDLPAGSLIGCGRRRRYPTPDMAFATRDLLIGGADIRAGEEIPEVVRFAGTDRPVDVAALVQRGDAAKTRRGLKADGAVE